MTRGAIYAIGNFRGTAEFTTGTISSSTADLAEVMLSKLSPDGQWVWARAISGNGNGLVGGSGVGASGELYIGGAFEGTSLFDAVTLTSAGQRDGFVSRVNTSSGAIEWAQRIGGVGLETLQDLDISPAGQPVVTGRFQGSASFGTQVLDSVGTQNTTFVAALNSDGSFSQSFRVAPGTISATGVFLSIASDGAMYALGNTPGVPRAQTPQRGSDS